MVKIYVFMYIDKEEPLLYHEGNTGDENSGYVVLVNSFVGHFKHFLRFRARSVKKSYCH